MQSNYILINKRFKKENKQYLKNTCKYVPKILKSIVQFDQID